MNKSMQVMKIDSPLRWRRWARSLANGAVTRRRGSLPLAVVRRRKSFPGTSVYSVITNRQFTTAAGIAIEPRIGLHAHTHLSHSVVRPVLHAATAARLEIVGLPSGPPHRMLSTHKLMRDLVERSKRIEERSMILARFASRTPGHSAGRSAPDAISRASGEWWKPDPETRTRPAPASAPPVNLEQITSSVLRQLDQRIGAWRERMGRS